eukprot:CAMPEP_0174283308 /NCGR_PEP_ID=MMETSP0809-20121228/3975_1 /TAXON_ID=73025 ORGANISM="Eutreptiella gymnastica-like, Strain CCMP1594" /NCGR_SAMPLE_ID=MMETSP0809 /ASSEMBLY_ACC=CAM_ASM_000658 /LENGTH=83 /DNA_ID=CAMNT_0015378141 /DNA_START=424 /DNA_END=672 /DNA_ORIENTATION=+
MTIFPALLRPVSIPNNPQIEWLLELGSGVIIHKFGFTRIGHLLRQLWHWGLVRIIWHGGCDELHETTEIEMTNFEQLQNQMQG